MKQITPAFCVALALAMTACTVPGDGGGTSAPPSATARASGARAYSLLANNHLLVVDVASGELISEITLAQRAGPATQMRGLALSSDRGSLYVLVRETSDVAVLATIDTVTAKVKATLPLSERLDYRGLAVGPRTGRLYLFANHGGDAVVRTWDPRDGSTQAWLARQADGRTWFVYQGGLAADESALYLSYHGPDTTGIDRFEIAPTGLVRCTIASSPDAGCFRTHGSFLLQGQDLFAATGQPLVIVLDPKSGVQRREYQLGLGGNHLMEFAITPNGELYAVGSCGYSGGLAVADLASGRLRVLTAPRQPDGVCGERIDVLDDGVLVIAKTARSVPDLAPGALVVVARSGEVLRTIRTSAEPIDLLLPR